MRFGEYPLPQCLLHPLHGLLHLVPGLDHPPRARVDGEAVGGGNGGGHGGVFYELNTTARGFVESSVSLLAPLRRYAALSIAHTLPTRYWWTSTSRPATSSLEYPTSGEVDHFADVFVGWVF